MEKHRCKLCFRNFANGKALGGHMRSHMTDFYSAKNASDDDQECVFHHSAPSSSSSEQDSKRVRKSSVFYSDREFFRVEKSKYDDQSPPPPSTAAEHEQLSSEVSDTTAEDEDIANCLMMLSRDKWGNKEDDYSVVKVVKKSFKVRGGKYRCETCGRLFRSYQALGGHRASHKKIRVSVDAVQPPPPPPRAAAVVVQKVHECPFCHRVFSSGQALGGHKRSHFIGAAAAANVNKPFSRIGDTIGIDLNLPAPSDDDEI